MADLVSVDRCCAAMKKYILMMNDGGRIAEYDRNRVKANFVPPETCTGGESARGAKNVLALFLIDGAIGSAELGRTAGFHFNENNNIFLARNNIDFGITGSWPIVASQNRQAAALEISVGKIFTALSQRGFGCQQLSLPKLPGRIAQLPEELPGRKWPG